MFDLNFDYDKNRRYVAPETLPRQNIIATLNIMINSRREAAHDSLVRAGQSGNWIVMDNYPRTRARAIKRCGCNICINSIPEV